MHITPLEIRKQPFRKSVVGGLDKSHVESFLGQIATEFESLRKENAALATKFKEQTGELARYKRIEDTLSETLLTAQRATDDARLNAQKEAELILKDAQLRAEKFEDGARVKVQELKAEYVSLKSQKESFLIRFRSLIQDQLSYVDIMKNGLDGVE